MKNIIQEIVDNWNKNPGVNNELIPIIEKQLNIVFPKDYVTFLEWSNGGEGFIGENYISLWKIENLVVLNKEYLIQKYLSKKFVGIGTDGGGICYGLLLDKTYSIFKCPLGDLDLTEITIIAKSINDFLRKALIKEL